MSTEPKIMKKEQKDNMFETSNLKDKFSKIYEENLFKGRHSRSGEGSDFVQTEVIRNELPRIIKEYNIKAFLDAPCGDWYWMQETKLGDGVKYIGVDIVDNLIEKNNKEFGNSFTFFRKVNLTENYLPRADLIFSRDCLVHLSFFDALKMISNFKLSGAKYLLTTTFVNLAENKELEGENSFWRPLNMELAPFNFPKPLLLINEDCTEENGKYSDKSLGLWKLKDIKMSYLENNLVKPLIKQIFNKIIRN
ncbi:MAG TPA: class I SAM-dependent methyltransferase [Rickettsia endosymbiont of Pyrocoelia pectoralis]|nr:class I SAM-dependent methyltransferase [Rickettsia endosymbiont of Pyrocoelia pectoralis]